MQVILDSLFARPGTVPIGGGKKGEFRDWTITTQKTAAKETRLFVPFARVQSVTSLANRKNRGKKSLKKTHHC